MKIRETLQLEEPNSPPPPKKKPMTGRRRIQGTWTARASAHHTPEADFLPPQCPDTRNRTRTQLNPGRGIQNPSRNSPAVPWPTARRRTPGPTSDGCSRSRRENLRGFCGGAGRWEAVFETQTQVRAPSRPLLFGRYKSAQL